MPQPQPSQFDRRSSCPGISGFVDALIASAFAAVERGRCKPDVAADLAAICEVPVEDLPRKYRREDRANSAELPQQLDLLADDGGVFVVCLCVLTLAIDGPDHFDHELQPLPPSHSIPPRYIHTLFLLLTLSISLPSPKA